MPAAADQASAATAPYTSQPENRPAAPQYTQQPEARPAQAPAPQQPEYNNLNQQQPPPPPATAAAAAAAAAARPSNYAEYLARQSQYPPPPNSQPGGPPTMAQATSSSPAPIDGKNRNQSNMKSDAVVPIDPSIAASSPTYPPPYSPYQPQPQGHDMTQYQGHPPPQMYARPEWAHGYPPPHHQHGMPGPYSAPATTVGTAAPTTTGPRPGQVRERVFCVAGLIDKLTGMQQVYSFVPIPGAQQHKRPRRRYEEIERMYKCGWNGCEKAYGTLNHLNAHVTMQSHGQKRTPEGMFFFFFFPRAL